MNTTPDNEMKHYECISCLAKMSGPTSPGRLVNDAGEPVGCAFCGSKQFRPVFKQLEPES